MKLEKNGMGGISKENTLKKISIYTLKETQRMNIVAKDLSPNKQCFLLKARHILVCARKCTLLPYCTGFIDT